MSQASSPGRCCWPLSLIRCGGPSATRTRTAAKRALSFPFVPVRQLMVRHLALASISSAGIDRMSGTCGGRGRPRFATGQIIRTSAGYTLRCRGIPTAQASLRAVSPKSLDWAREMQARHRYAYPPFHQWRGDVVAQAHFDEAITSPFGWRLIVTANTKTRTLMNFLAQAGGGDVMRLVSIVATACGITVAAPVHDAFWILSPLDDLDTTIARTPRS